MSHFPADSSAPAPPRTDAAQPFRSVSTRWLWLGLTLAAGVALFGRLGALSLRQWDEARLAVSALEMVRSGNWLVTTYEGLPDLWSVKPPLVIWLQAGLIQLLGPTEWAVRLPAAVAGLGTVGLLFDFCARTLRRPVTGLVAGLILLGAEGFVGRHVTRTGDYDAPLVFFQVLLSLGYFRWLENPRPRAWVGIGAGLVLATLTKGIAALLAGPGLLLYSLSGGRWRRVLTARGFWLATLGWAVVVAGWYGLREAASPGYLTAVWENELGGRYQTALEGHTGPWYYYLQVLRAQGGQWRYGLPLLAWALWPATGAGPTLRRRAAAFATLWVVGYLMVVSASQTKLLWYAAPVYPWLALGLALGVDRAWRFVRECWPNRWVGWGFVLTTAGALLIPYGHNTRHQLNLPERDPDLNCHLGYGIRDWPAIAGPLFVLTGREYDQAIRFYSLVHSRVQCVPVEALATLPDPRPGAGMLTIDVADQALIERRWPRAHLLVGGPPPYFLYRW